MEIYLNWISAPLAHQNLHARPVREDVTHYNSCSLEQRSLRESLTTRVKTCQIQFPIDHISSLEENYPFAFSILVHK